MPFLTWAGNVICESASGAGIKQEVRSNVYQLHILHAVDSSHSHPGAIFTPQKKANRRKEKKSDWQEVVMKQIKPCDQNRVS